MPQQRTSYSKPHLSCEDQVELLASRGLQVENRDEAVKRLSEIGYYRLSGYFYPFREQIPHEQQEYEREYRYSTFVTGSRFSDTLRLYWFDMGLRALVFGATRDLEIYLRAKVSGALAETDPFGYERPGPIDTSTTKRLKNFARWDSSATKSVRQSARTDFMKHFFSKYTQDAPPIWMLIETLDFGGLTSLYSVLNREIQNNIANSFGVVQGSIFENWLQNVRDVRNVTAHHSRLWNARLNFSISNAEHVHADLAHLRSLPKNKIYATLALMQYFFRSADIQPNFKDQVKRHISMFPEPSNGAVSVRRDMGFPAQWESLPLWN